MTSRPSPEPPDPLLEADDLLLARIGNGDEAAFRQLLERHLDRAYGLARRILRNTAQAEAVAQAVMLELWAQRGTGPSGQGGLLVSLYQGVVARCRDPQRWPRPDDMAAGAESAGERPGAGADHPAETTSLLDLAMAQLPEQERLALILSYTDGLGNSEIASVLDTSLASLESLLAQGRRRLRQLLRKARRGTRAPFTDN